MKIILTFFMLCVGTVIFSQDCLHIVINNTHKKPMPLALYSMGNGRTLETMVDRISKDLSWEIEPSWGFSIEKIIQEKLPSKHDLKVLADKGTYLAILLSIDENESVSWRVYDTKSGSMIAGKKIKKLDNKIHYAHVIANQLWQALTGFEGIFGTSIAYCKQRINKKQILRDIFVDCLGSNEHTLFVKGGKLLAPRWNNDPTNPSLLYSEITLSNVRLLSMNLERKRSIISNFDGFNILPSVSPNGKNIVYCSSRTGNSQIYHYVIDENTGGWVFKKVIENNGNNISPTVCDNGDILFCSDFKTKHPQLYWYAFDDGSCTRITYEGYCASPSYCCKTRSIAYIKLVDNCMQLFVCDGKTHKQLTFDQTNKDEPCWSAQGDYIAFSVEKDATSRIALMHRARNDYCFLTDIKDYCSYPTWSSYFVMG